jgi:hypothetical protein
MILCGRGLVSTYGNIFFLIGGDQPLVESYLPGYADVVLL